jgi:cytochrome c556
MKKSLIAALVIGIGSSAAMADGHVDKALQGAIDARQAAMKLYAFNLGQLGAMAKGAMDYDADKAAGAASNLYALVTMDQSSVWPAGSDNGAVDTTRALPAIWNDFPGVMAASKAMVEAAATMKDAAGTDLASLQGAIGAVGGACGGCHKAYRAPAN